MTPDNDPDLISKIMDMANSQGIPVAITFILSWLRIQYDGSQPKLGRSILEVSILSMLVLIVGMACDEWGASKAWSFIAAGVCGGFGLDVIRAIGFAYAKKRAGLDDDKHE